jgi:cation transport regulator
MREDQQMPYDKLGDLPESVSDNLPHHAQEIYQAAYNNAWDQYDHDEARAPSRLGRGRA